MKARFTGLFAMKTTRNTFNVTSTSFRNGVKIGIYVLAMREIILPILTSSLVVRFSLSPKRLIWVSHWLLIYPGTPKRRKLYIKPTRLWVSLKVILVQGTRKSFLVFTRPWLYPFWNMLSLSGHPINRRTLTLLNESNVGPRNTLSWCNLGNLRTR